LARVYLGQYLKELDERHLDHLIRSEGAENPLYLKIVLAELRVFGSFATLGEKIRGDFGDTPVTAFDSVLSRLESDPAYAALPPQRAVPLMFGLLAHSRYGLTVPELADIFIQVLGLEDNPTSREAASETLHLFLRQLRPYLARRGGRYDFFFPSLRTAVTERYVTAGPADLPPKLLKENWHGLLGAFFHELPTWQSGSSTPEGMITGSLARPSHRKVTELPYQLTGAKDHRRLETVLSDIDFIDAKCRAGMAADLAKDYQRARITSQPPSPPVQSVLRFGGRMGAQCLFCSGWAEVKEADLGQELPCPYCGYCMTADFRIEEGEWTPSTPKRGYGKSGDGPDHVFSSTVKEYAEFITNQIHFLALFPMSALQQAANLPDASSPSRAARDHLASDGGHPPWLEHLNKPQALIRRMAIPVGATECVYSPDGRRILSRDGGELREWDAATGEELARSYDSSGPLLEETAPAEPPDFDRTLPEGPIRAYSPDRTRFVKGYSLLDGKTGGELGRISPLHLSEDLRSCAFSPDGRLLVCATSRGIDVLDVEALEEEFGSDPGTTQFTGLWNWVMDLSYSPDGRRIAVHQRYDKGFPKVLSIHEDRVDFLPGQPAPVLDCSYSKDGDAIVSASGFNLRIWDGSYSSKGQLLSLLTGEVAGDDTEEEDWDDLYEGHEDVVLTCALSPDGDRAVSGSKDCSLTIWNVETAEVRWVMTGHDVPVTVCGYSPDGESIVSGDEDGILRIWDAESGKELSELKGHSGPVTACAYSQDGELIVTGSEDGTLVLWDAGSGEEKARLFSNTSPVRGCAFSPRGDRIYSLSGAGTLTTWDGATFDRLDQLQGPVDSVTCCSFSHDRRRVVSAADRTLTVWDASEGTMLAQCEGHTDRVRCCDFSPD